MRERMSARYGYGRLITPSEIQLITGYNFDAAEREHAYVRQQLGTGSEDLLVEQYCEYSNLDFEEIMDFLHDENPDFEEETLEDYEAEKKDKIDADFMPDDDDENEQNSDPVLEVKFETENDPEFEIDIMADLAKIQQRIRSLDTPKAEK